VVDFRSISVCVLKIISVTVTVIR